MKTYEFTLICNNAHHTETGLSIITKLADNLPDLHILFKLDIQLYKLLTNQDKILADDNKNNLLKIGC